MAEGEDPKEGAQPSEVRFFQSKPREDSFVGHVGPLPPRWPMIAAAVVAGLAIVGLAVWQMRSPAEGTLWVMNPGPGKVMVAIGDGDPEELRPARLIDRTVRAGPVRVAIERDGKTTTETIEVGPGEQGVTVLDLGGEAAYVILNVSAHYADGAPEPDRLPLTHLSPAAKVHSLPLPATKLVRPAQPLPDKGSWELNAFKLPGAPLEIHKVFRVDPQRTAERDQLVGILSEGVRNGHATDFENARRVVTSTAPSDSLIPRAGD
ncbi:MAG: hypothetical protein IT384_29400 [Deltaproteobacteria bacterium]|nr:hypothetical protein [Deltaproteobacteria bacterium]